MVRATADGATAAANQRDKAVALPDKAAVIDQQGRGRRRARALLPLLESAASGAASRDGAGAEAAAGGGDGVARSDASAATEAAT